MGATSSVKLSPRSRKHRDTVSAKKIWKRLQSGTDFECAKLIRNGLPSSTLQIAAHLLDTKTEHFCAMLKIRRRKANAAGVLSTDDGGKVFMIILALKEASRAFGTTSGAKQWLLRPLRSFGGVAPLSLLDTAAGFEMVRQSMRRIEHGFCA